MKMIMLAVILIGTSSSAGPSGDALIRTHFNVGWSSVETVPPPVATPPSAPLPDEELNPGDQVHSPIAHMDITVKAYQLYASRYVGSELGHYLGAVNNRRPARDQPDNLVAGSYDEDSAYKNPFGQMISPLRHFWDYRKGPRKGLWKFDSSVNRAHKYWSGGFGINGKYDRAWSGDGKAGRGVRGMGAVALYSRGDKARAYWYLGHVAHLLEDLTVPAHALLYPHPTKGSDAYEAYTKKHFNEWSPRADEPEETFANLYELFERTGKITARYDAGRNEEYGVDGTADQGKRRAGGFSDGKLHDEAAVLMPLAFERVASLFVLYYKEVDRVPPAVTLAEPVGTITASLTAAGRDDLSGLDRRSWMFEARADGETQWKQIAASGPFAEFTGEPGRLYAFRASARDAAGNVGYSGERWWRAAATTR